MKVLGDTSIPTFAAWGNTAFGRIVEINQWAKSSVM